MLSFFCLLSGSVVGKRRKKWTHCFAHGWTSVFLNCPVVRMMQLLELFCWMWTLSTDWSLNWFWILLKSKWSDRIFLIFCWIVVLLRSGADFVCVHIGSRGCVSIFLVHVACFPKTATYFLYCPHSGGQEGGSLENCSGCDFKDH